MLFIYSFQAQEYGIWISVHGIYIAIEVYAKDLKKQIYSEATHKVLGGKKQSKKVEVNGALG